MEQARLKKLVKGLQHDLPLTSRPYKEIASKSGITEEELLRSIKELQDTGIIRRIGAVVRHHRLGITANGMGVWKVSENDTERIGAIMASFPEVSHCYQRPVFADWPYNLFTMIHASTLEECEDIAARISEKTGLKDYKLLFSSKEFKKCSMIYY